MAHLAYNARSPTVKRILKEAQEMRTQCDPSIFAAPLEADIFEWHFTIRGPPGSPYEKGIYHGRIILPSTYPLRPPSFRFLTPSGRFEINREICLSISGHHEETWQPAWGIRTALWALRAFMEADSQGQVGGMLMTSADRTRLAEESLEWKCTNCGDQTNHELLQAVPGKQDATENSAKHIVPDQLQFGFRDEMTPNRADDKVSDSHALINPPESESESAATAAATPQASVWHKPTDSNLELRHVHSKITTPQPLPAQDNANREDHNDRVSIPSWIDKAICGTIVALLAMLAKDFIR